MQTVPVADLCAQSEMQALVVAGDMPLATAVRLFATDHNLRGIFLTGENGRLTGVLNKQDLLHWVGLQLDLTASGEPLTVGRMRRLVNAQHVADLAAPGSAAAAVSLDETLADALRKMATYDLLDIPVVDEDGRVVNDLRLSEILAYMLDKGG